MCWFPRSVLAFLYLFAFRSGTGASVQVLRPSLAGSMLFFLLIVGDFGHRSRLGSLSKECILLSCKDQVAGCFAWGHSRKGSQ